MLRYCGSCRVRAADQATVGYRIHGEGLLYQSMEEQASVARGATVETEGELVKVVGQVRSFWPALVGAEQPSLEEGSDAVRAGQSHRYPVTRDRGWGVTLDALPAAFRWNGVSWHRHGSP